MYQRDAIGIVQVNVALIFLVVAPVVFHCLGIVLLITVAISPQTIAVLVVRIDGYGIVNTLDGVTHFIEIEMGFGKNLPIPCIVWIDVYQFLKHLDAFLVFLLGIENFSVQLLVGY